MIEFNCPICGRQIRVSELHAGKIGSCKECGERIRIPKSTNSEVPHKPDEAKVKEAFEHLKSSPLGQLWKKTCEKHPETPIQVGCVSIFILALLVNMIFKSFDKPSTSDYPSYTSSPALRDAKKTVQRYEDMEKAKKLYNSLGDLPPGPERDRRATEVEDILRRHLSE